MRPHLVLALWAVLCFAGLGIAAQSEITEVVVRGNLRVESGVILQKVKTHAGEPYDAKQVREDIRSIYSLGYFDDVVVELDEKGLLTFLVRERPALREWRVEDSEHLEKEDWEKALTMLKRREILDQARVDEGARALRDAYREKGYYLAEARPETVPVPDGKNQVDVVYRVEEGRKVRVKDINLLGVEKVSEKDIRSSLTLSEAGYWSWLTGSGKFKDTDLEHDREVIRAYYLNHGYVDVEVFDPLVSLTSDREWLKIDIPVVEGESFRIGTVRFSGDLEFPESKLSETAALKEGETFRSDDIRRAQQTLSDLYGDIGYAFVDVEPRTRVDKEAGTVSLEFAIRKGDLIRLGRIEIRGNTKTRDRVVRREILLSEGDLYNATAFRKTRQRLENLGFFEKASLATRRRPEQNVVDVDVDVEEKSTGAFSIGAGYSSVDKIVGMASVSQRNFLGLGYQVAVTANLGSTRETYSFTFNNPRVYDTDLYAGFDLYKSDREYTDFDKKSIGGDVKAGYPLSDEWRARWIYRLEEATVRNVSADAATFIKDQEGTLTTSSITTILSYDTRDNQWDPRRGAKADGSIEFAGLGGDVAFLRYELDASKYLRAWWKTMFTLHGNVGYVQGLFGKDVPIYERFFLGGINTIRGFSLRSIGPKDLATGDVIGGDKDIFLNVEYLFPIAEEAKLKGLLFFDAGNAWGNGQPYFATALRRSAGAGVRWISPMGPLRLEWGYVLDRKQDEGSSKFEFSIGGFF